MHIAKIEKSFKLIFLLTLFLFPLHSESFRVHKVVPLKLSSTDEKVTIKSGINDGVLIELPEDKTFVQGIELYFKVPQNVADWYNSVAWSIYSNISPKPKESVVDYTGTRQTVGTFGNSLSLTVKIPFSKRNSIKKDSYSYYVEEIPDIKDNKIFLRLQLAMKGVPSSISDSLIEITARPIFINKGRLVLNVVPAENEQELKEITYFIDGKQTELKDGNVILDTGMHTVNLTSDFYRNEVRTINIEQAKNSQLTINMRTIQPYIRIVSPAGSSVTLDDKQIEDFSQPFLIESGEHIVKIELGGYEIIKNFTVVNGRNYNISVSFDALVSEEE